MCFISSIHGQTITSYEVSCSPSIVGEISATLVTKFITTKSIPSNGFIAITVPTEANLVSSVTTCTLVVDGITKTNTCQMSGRTAFVKSLTSINSGLLVEVRVDNGFITPSSTQSTTSFSIITYLSDKVTVQDTRTSDIILKVNADSLSNILISPTSDGSGVVGQSTKMLVQITNQNLIPANGQIQVILPKWDTESSNPQSMVISPTNLKCTSFSGMDSSITCSYAQGTTQDTLTISNALTQGKVANSQFSFIIDSIKNPISKASISITVQTLIANGQGIIDSSVTTYAPTTEVTISSTSARFEPEDFTVQELTTYNLQFTSPVPLNSGSVVLITFPSSFTFDTRLQSIEGFALFGDSGFGSTGIGLTFTKQDSTRLIRISNAVTTYRQENSFGLLKISSLQNPYYVAQTESLTIQIQDKNGNGIAILSSNLFMTPIKGLVNSISALTDLTEINKVAKLTISFTPAHYISTSGMIQVTLPSVVSSTCDFTYTGFSTGTLCTQQSSQVLRFVNMFNSEYQSGSLSIVLTKVTLPGSAQDISGITIQTYEQANLNDLFLIDEGSISKFLTVTPSLFASGRLEVLNQFETYSTANFVFTFTLQNPIPTTGLLKIRIPPEITVKNPSTVASSCLDRNGNLSGIQCTVALSGSFYFVTLKKSVLNSASSIIQFSIGGLLTPISTKTSSSFQVVSTDSLGNLIDQQYNDLTLTMSFGRYITQLTVIPESATNGDYTPYQVSFTTLVPLQANWYVIIYFPDEILAPLRSKITCYSSGQLQSTQPCAVNGQIVTIQLQPSSSIGENSQLSFRIIQARNPTSTQPSTSFQMLVQDNEGFSVAQTKSDFTGAKVTTQFPGQISQYSMTALDPYQFSTTTITLTFKNLNPIPIGGYIHVKYDSIWIWIKDTNTLKCSSNLVQIIDCVLPSGSEIQFKNLFLNPAYSNQTVSVTVNNMYLDINTKMTTKSWILTTYTKDGFAIDRISTGLTLTFPCNPPCKTCDINSPSFCTSCNSYTGKTILFNNKCYDTCPSGTYYDNGNCFACDPKCVTCSADNRFLCTSCNIESQLYPYLSGTSCTDTCLDGTFANNKTAKCENCQSPCLTCEGSAQSCLICNQNTPNRFQLNRQCLSACPSGYVSNEQGICLPCDPTCKECSITPSTCTSCQGTLTLSFLDNTCVTTCQYGKTIFNAKTNRCDLCSQKCKTCEGTISKCTSCQSGLNFKQYTNECVGDCSGTNNLMVAVDGVCESCSPVCKTCQGKPDLCLSCPSNKYFFNFKCVDKCPADYVSNNNNQCILDGLQCPFGYEVNSQGNACMLMAQICEAGYKLNISKTKCIPIPGKYAPFPLVIASVLISVLAFFSRYKFQGTLLVTNIISFVSLVETVGLLMQTILAYDIGLYSTFALTFISLMFQYGSNFFFMIIYIKQILTDPNLKYWSMNYRITQRIVQVVGMLFNFKFYRMIYGKFFGFDHFNAPFDDANIFFRPFTFISVFNIITTTLPLLVANIIGLVFIEWGYQITMTCLEMMIIEVVMLGLIIYEKVKIRQQLLRQQPYYKIDPKQNLTDNVMGGFDDSYFSQGGAGVSSGPGQVSQYPLLASAENEDKKKLLEKLLNIITGRQKDQNKVGETTIDFINELQEQEYMKAQLRRCRSFKELREEDYMEEVGGTGSEAGDELDVQNFISAPNSPREKQMLHNPRFFGRMTDFKRAQKLRDNYDNVYADALPLHQFPMKDCKLVTVKVQTNLAELLGIDDLEPYADNRLNRFNMRDSEEGLYVEEMLDGDYASRMINNVLDSMADSKYKKKRRRLPQSRMIEIPEFDLSEIMGDFEIDEDGNAMIIKGKDAKLNDREGRRVNKRGYLVDVAGNIVTRTGLEIFRIDEVDSDDEIPAPFCFEKKKESLFKVEGMAEYHQKTKKGQVLVKEDEIEKEYNRLKMMNQQQSNRSSVESLMGETPSKYNKKNKRKIEKKTEEDQEEDFLSKIVKPMQAKSKHELMKIGGINGTNEKPSSKVSPKDAKHKIDIESQMTMDSKRGGIGGLSSMSRKRGGLGGDTSIEERSLHDKSSRELFYSALSNKQGVNKGRPHFTNIGSGIGGTQSTMQSQNYKFGSSLDPNVSTEQKLQQLKEALGQNREDQLLLKNLQRIEESFKQQRKKPLVQKNLSKIYGKVKDKYNAQQFHPSVGTTGSINMSRVNLEDDEAISQKTQQFAGIRRPGTNLDQSDSRMKGLEQIYLKPQIGHLVKPISQNQLPRFSHLHSGNNTGQYKALQQSINQSLAFENEDQEELRMNRELEMMKQILDKETTLSSKNNTTQNKVKQRQSIGSRHKGVLEGGYL